MKYFSYQTEPVFSIIPTIVTFSCDTISSKTTRCVLAASLALVVLLYVLSQTRPTSSISLTAGVGRLLQHAKHVANVVTGKPLLEGENSDPDNYQRVEVVDAEMGWTPYMDIIDEETALKDPPIVDIQTAVSVNNSRVYLKGNDSLIDNSSVYKIGDTVRVRIDLYNGYGNCRQRGGDQLRVRISETSLKASASGYVVDHYNGSYTAILKCLWAGTPTILVYISYTREAVRAVYFARKKMLTTRPVLALYENEEVQKCHPFVRRLGNPKNACNMTSLNGNMSWYCKAPRKAKCADLQRFIKKQPYPKLPITVAEEILLKRNMEHLQPSLLIEVDGSESAAYEGQRKPPCSTYNRTKLWFQASPIGHFMDDKWEPFHCTEPPVEKFESCLRNKHLLFYGDSTIRQWFFDILLRYNCTITTEEWTQEKWKRNSAAVCTRNNLTIEWIVHAFPGNLDKKLNRKKNSIARNMLKFAHNKNAIFVIHLLCHLSAYHHDVFRDRISHIRKSVDLILKANKDAKILIKGGHTFHDLMHISDYYSYVYRTIEIEEFRGLYDKVVYLDNKDMTIAKEVRQNHPTEDVVREMVNQMLAYVCDP